MPIHTATIFESFIADGAHIWLCVRMRTNVIGQMRQLSESFAAELTLVRTRDAVTQLLVFHEFRLRGKMAATDRTCTAVNTGSVIAPKIPSLKKNEMIIDNVLNNMTTYII